MVSQLQLVVVLILLAPGLCASQRPGRPGPNNQSPPTPAAEQQGPAGGESTPPTSPTMTVPLPASPQRANSSGGDPPVVPPLAGTPASTPLQSPSPTGPQGNPGSEDALQRQTVDRLNSNFAKAHKKSDEASRTPTSDPAAPAATNQVGKPKSGPQDSGETAKPEPGSLPGAARAEADNKGNTANPELDSATNPAPAQPPDGAAVPAGGAPTGGAPSHEAGSNPPSPSPTPSPSPSPSLGPDNSPSPSPSPPVAQASSAPSPSPSPSPSPPTPDNQAPTQPDKGPGQNGSGPVTGESHQGQQNPGMIAGAVVGGATLLAALVGLIIWLRHKRRRGRGGRSSSKSFFNPFANPFAGRTLGYAAKPLTAFNNKGAMEGGGYNAALTYSNGTLTPAGGQGGQQGLQGPTHSGGSISKGLQPTRSGAAAAAVVPASFGIGALAGGAAGGMAMAVGFTGDELQECVRDVKYVVTNRVLPAVDNATLAGDPFVTWLEAGMADVRSRLSNAAYGASHAFVEDWRSHRLWEWLNRKVWKFIPTEHRLLGVQADPSMSQEEYARQMVSKIRRDPEFPPFIAAASEWVEKLLEDAVKATAALQHSEASAQHALPTRALSDSSAQHVRDQDEGAAQAGVPEATAAAAAEAAGEYYRPVLLQLLKAALRLHLQVQATMRTAYVFVPGSPPAVEGAVPPGGVSYRERMGREVRKLMTLCERPGVFSADASGTHGAEKWVEASAIRLGLLAPREGGKTVAFPARPSNKGLRGAFTMQ